MNLVDLYRDVMAINGISDHSQRQSRAEAFFETIRKAKIPEKFNWAAEIFESVHVRERGDQAALIWTDLETGAEARFTYAQLAAKGNQLLNCLRKHGVDHHGNIYMMASIVPETWFASFAAVKGGLVTVPTATNMTVRELE